VADAKIDVSELSIPIAPVSLRERYAGIDFVRIAPFVGFHVLALACIFLYPPTWRGIALCVGLYYARMFGIAGGYHRYFSHRTFKTSRFFQFVLAFLGGTAMQKGALWWAANHRHHHRYSDQIEDVHSPIQGGFFWSHVGWVLSPRYDATDWEAIPDFGKYPELRFLNRYHMVPPLMLAGVLYLLGGVYTVVWGFVISTVVLWHGTFVINSLAHVFGRRRFPTTDTSRNSLTLSLVTMGEGWHNNHHYYPGSMSQGFYWWQIDTAAYVVKLLSYVGLVWEIRKPPERVLALGRGKVSPSAVESVAATFAAAEPS
jgi:stearoyl-CoA desaturase (delta-9 desaturase)